MILTFFYLLLLIIIHFAIQNNFFLIFNINDKFAEDYNLSKKVKSKDFILSKNIIYTLSRRFKSKSIWFMTKLMFLSFINRNNQKFFEKTHSYWS